MALKISRLQLLSLSETLLTRTRHTPLFAARLSANSNKRFLCRLISLSRQKVITTQSPTFVGTSCRLNFSTMTEPKIAPLKLCSDLKSGEFDGVVVVGPSIKDLPHALLRTPLQAVADIDQSAEQGVFVVAGQEVKRVVFSGTGPLDKDYDDVRRLVVHFFLYFIKKKI